MKNLIFIISFCCLHAMSSFSQSPQGFRYQGVARKANGDLIKNQNIGLRLSILKGGPSGGAVYIENHTVPTGDLGVFSLTVGQGSVQSGSFSSVDWGTDSYWLNTELDPDGGSNYVSLGATQILSVPYALHASTVSDKDDADADPANELQSLSKSGNVVSLSKNGGSFTDAVDDADADPGNELQSLQLSGQNLEISKGNSVDLSAIGSKWKDETNGISYFKGTVYTDEIQSESRVQVGNNTPNSVTIVPWGLDVDDYNGSGTTNTLKSSQIYMKDKEIERALTVGLDSMVYFKQGIGLLYNSQAVFNPEKLSFEFGEANTSLTAGSLFHTIGINNAHYYAYGMRVDEVLSPSDVFTRVQLEPDNFSLINDVKWQNVWLGTQSTQKNGQLRLSSGANDQYIATLGSSSFLQSEPPEGELLLFSRNGEATVNLSAFNSNGSLSLWGEGRYNLTGNGFQNMGVYLPGPNPALLEERYAAGVTKDGNNGYVKIHSISGEDHAGISTLPFLNRGHVYSDGAISLKYPGANTYGNAMAPYGFVVKDSNGIEAALLTNDAIQTNIGYLWLYGDNSVPNLYAGANWDDLDPNGGAISLFDSNGLSQVSLSASNVNGGKLELYRDGNVSSGLYRTGYISLNNGAATTAMGTKDLVKNIGSVNLFGGGSLNVYAGDELITNLAGYESRGMVAVADVNNSFQAGMYVNQNNQGVLFADIKNFRVNDPNDNSKEIWYASLEGPEAAAYLRGTATLRNGEAFVEFPEYFTSIASEKNITVILTPLDPNTYGLAAISKSTKGIRVKELMNGSGNFSFDWEVKAIRQGYENYQVLRERQERDVDNLEQSFKGEINADARRENAMKSRIDPRRIKQVVH
jgi:hypothetical protein